ncbi:MAG: ABC transporter permease [bacterium]|nr:ABC transporter permease [bacterium]
MSAIARDSAGLLRYAARRLSKQPGFTATAVFSLALGIGANTAIFSLVNAVLIRELPLRAPEELVVVFVSTPDFEYNVFSYPDYEDLRDGTGEVFSGLAGARLIITQTDRDGGIETLIGEAVTGNLFPVLGVAAQVGRTLLPEDDESPGGHPVVMLGHDYWQSRYAGDRAAVGQEIRIGGRSYTIIGVAPESYPGSFRALTAAIYVPIMMINEVMPSDSDELEERGHHSIFVKARLRPGVSLPQAQAAADAVAAHLRELDLEEWDPDARFSFVPQEEVILYPPFDRFVRAASWLLMVVVGLVLLMACINLASFLLAKSLDRRKEIAVRLALGAQRRSLVGQLLTETALLGLLGGLAGVGLAFGLLRLLFAADLPLPVPVDLDLGLDLRVLAFSLAISLAAGVLLGLAPALQNLRGDLAQTLRSEGAGGGQGGKLRLRNALVIFQVAISLVLLLAAGLFLRSMQRLQSVDPGFGHRPTALLTFLIPATRYDEETGRVLARRLVERFEQLPGVEAVGLTDNLHLNVMNTQMMDVNVDGVEPPAGRDSYLADRAAVDEGFFEAAGIEILQGRAFERSDRSDTEPVAIISEAMARRFWGSGDPLGQMIRPGGENPDLQVIGVASDAKVRSLGEAPRAFVYRPLSQDYGSNLTAVARTAAGPERTSLELLAAAREIEPELFVWKAETMERHLGIVRLPGRLSAVLLSAFAVLALILAVVGLYGLVSYSVAQRQREMGIRMALGADGGAVVRLLVRHGAGLVLIGGAVGLLAGAVLARLLTGLLFGVSALDPTTFVVLPLVLGAAGLAAALVPALAARRIDPAAVLRAE